MAVEKHGNSRNFFLLLCGHPELDFGGDPDRNPDLRIFLKDIRNYTLLIVLSV